MKRGPQWHVFGLTGLLVLCEFGTSGCLNDTKLEGPGGTPPKPSPRSLGTFAVESTRTYNARFDTWWERKSQSCSNARVGTDARYYSYNTCSRLVVQHWDTNSNWLHECAAAVDFATAGLPDCAIVTSVTLDLWYEASQVDDTEPTEPLGCLNSFVGTLESHPVLATFYAPVDSAGASQTARYVVPGVTDGEPDGSDPNTSYCGSPYWALVTPLASAMVLQGSGGDVGGYTSLAVNNFVSRTGVSRYCIDNEGTTGQNRYSVFTSMEGQSGRRPTLTVKFLDSNPSFVPYVDAGIAHKDVNCTSCSMSDFDTTTTATTYEVHKTAAQTKMCGEKQALMRFDTGFSAVTRVPCAHLQFHVHSVSGLSVEQHHIRFYVKYAETSGAPSASDFIGCSGASYYNLGNIPIYGSGTYSFAMPVDDRIRQVVSFVLTDDSTFTDEDGTSTIVLDSRNVSSSSLRPVLTTQ